MQLAVPYGRCVNMSFANWLANWANRFTIWSNGQFVCLAYGCGRFIGFNKTGFVLKTVQFYNKKNKIWKINIGYYIIYYKRETSYRWGLNENREPPTTNYTPEQPRTKKNEYKRKKIHKIIKRKDKIHQAKWKTFSEFSLCYLHQNTPKHTNTYYITHRTTFNYRLP